MKVQIDNNNKNNHNTTINLAMQSVEVSFPSQSWTKGDRQDIWGRNGESPAHLSLTDPKLAIACELPPFDPLILVFAFHS